MLALSRAGAFVRPGFFTDIGAGIVCVAIAVFMTVGLVRSFDPGAVRVCHLVEVSP